MPSATVDDAHSAAPDVATPAKASSAPWASVLDDDPHADVVSNIESFVVSTTPLVPARDVPGDVGRGNGGGRRAPFALCDLWASFDEWSAFGVEVPLLLDDQDREVFQYYVPFLSGMQIFRACDPATEAGADDESRVRDDAAPEEDPEAAARASSAPPLPSGIARATAEGAKVPGRELLFQYFERASPYSRAPISDTLERLCEEEPTLATLRSDDVHPASWISVAWYPIYRVPVGRSLRDLSACFLTYHALSNRVGDAAGSDEREAVGRGEGAAVGEGGGGGGEGGGGDGGGERTMISPEEESAYPEAPTSSANDDAADACPEAPAGSPGGEAALARRAARLRAADAEGRERVGLRAFGMSHYKLRGEPWRAAEVANWLATMLAGADGWLRKLKVIHPDFEFFQHQR
jgi:hypothetical protein